MSDASNTTRALLDRVLADFNTRDIDTIMQHFADDSEMISATGPDIWGARIVGKDAIRAALADRIRSCPDIQWTDCESVVEGSRAVTKWRVTGHFADGRELDLWGCDHWRFEGDKIVVKDTYFKQKT